MPCERFAGPLKDVAAGGEPAPELAAHVAQCPSCREAVAAQRRIIESIDNDVMRAVRVEPSADFEARVRLRVAADPTPSAARWFGRWRLATALASLALVAVVLTVVLGQWGSVGRGRTPTLARAPMTNSADHARVEPAAPRDVPRAHVGEPDHGPGHPMVSERLARARVAPFAHVKQARGREPEVLVAQDQQLVVARLFQMLRTGKLDEKALDQPSEVPAPQPIVVGELTVTPIVVAPTGNEKQQ